MVRGQARDRALSIPSCLAALTAAAALVAATAAHGSEAVAPCALDALRLAVETQGESTTARIGISLRSSAARSCRLSAPVTVTILHAGRWAPVRGNPLRRLVSGVLARGFEKEVLAADWQNWCAGQSGVRLVVSYGTLMNVQPLPVLPACLDRHRPSSLALIR